jgi:O-antigen ligase
MNSCLLIGGLAGPGMARPGPGVGSSHRGNLAAEGNLADETITSVCRDHAGPSISDQREWRHGTIGRRRCPMKRPLPLLTVSSANSPITANRSVWQNKFAAPAPVIQSAQREESNSAIATIGFYFALLFVFLRFSYLGEILSYKFGMNIRLALLVGPPTCLLLFLSGGIRRSFQGKASSMFIGYLFWLLVAAPFSVWPGGTFDTLKSAFLTEFSMFFIVTGLVRSVEEVRKMSAAIAISGVLNLVICRSMGTYDTGRLSLPFGTLQNPNDLAVHLILVLPFVIMMFYTSAGRFSLWRVMAIPAVISAVYAVLLSGSRMALIALALLTMFIVIRSTMTQRVLLLGSFALASGIALLCMPSLTIQRYMTMFNSEPVDIVDMNEYQGAMGSTEARKRLLLNSIRLTFENPLFGVGPGQFAVEEEALQRSMGLRGSWQVTHNTYTQVSSEAGFPAVTFYLGSIVFALAGLYGIRTRGLQHSDKVEILGSISFCLQLSIVGLAVCSLFGALAYRHYLPTLLGLAIAFTHIAKRQLDQGSTAQSVRSIPAINTRTVSPSPR